MRSALLAAMICALPTAAVAQPVDEAIRGELEQPDGYLILEAPKELRTYDEPAARRRVDELDRAVGVARDPIARARLQLERATLRSAQGRHERIALLTAQIRQDGIRDRVARRALDPEIAIRRAATARANAAAIADLTELVCDASERGRGFGCRAPSALRTWPALDDALFQLAFVLSSEKRADDAARVYRRILDDHPGSRHRGDALIAVADHAFEHADLATAEALYRAAQASPASVAAPVRAYAAYKLGWVHLNLGRGKDAFASLVAAAALAGTDPRSAMLVRAARKDLARAFADHGAPADAFAAFETAAPGHGLDLLERLADHWLDIARSADASAVYRELAQRTPAHARRCDWQLAIARAAQLAGPTSAMVFEVEALATVVDQTRSLPSAVHCARESRTFVYEAAQHQLRAAAAPRSPNHAAARRNAPAGRPVSAAPAAHAERMFAAFVRGFPGDPDRATARLRRAEAALLRAELASARTPGDRRAASILFRRAADRFDEAVKSGGLRPGESTRAAEARTHALQRAATP